MIIFDTNNHTKLCLSTVDGNKLPKIVHNQQKNKCSNKEFVGSLLSDGSSLRYVPKSLFEIPISFGIFAVVLEKTIMA